MGTWALAVFYDQANNRLRLLFPLREPSVFSLDRRACAPFNSHQDIGVIERATSARKGDLAHVIRRVRQNSYNAPEGKRYTVELIADGFAILAKDSEQDAG